MISTNTLINRKSYLDKLIGFRDTELVKIITGIRRCGKSSLLKLMVQHLHKTGVAAEQILEINFEYYAFKDMNADELYRYVKERVMPGKRMYLFLDELQRVPAWEDAVNAFRAELDCDIYVTGSNAYLLSSEYSTYLSGRCVEIKMLPLSFREFLLFNGFQIKERTGAAGIIKKRICTADGEPYDLREVFDLYMRYGGMPGMAETGLVQEKALALLDSIYSTVVVRDILEREKRRGQKQITDAVLLRKIILFLADNIGNNVSVTTMGNILVNEGLCTLGKYYVADTGLRNYLLGFRNRDSGHMLENIVYFELLRRGYDVAIGKVDAEEVDFIAAKADDRKYIQVTESMLGPDVRERELGPLRNIRDNYEKTVLSLEPGLDASYDGIKSLHLLDWLLEGDN